ncbi:hypothetical protein EV1_033514 [Malus domestica]
MRSTLIPQPVLLVPPRAPLAHLDLRSDYGGPAWPPHGVANHGSSFLQAARMEFSQRRSFCLSPHEPTHISIESTQQRCPR